MAANDPAMLPFDALESSLKTVLLHTGSALSNATGARDGTKLLMARLQLERNLPDALKKWHNAIFELESQLTTCKAALHRDLAELRASKNASAKGTSPAMSLDSDTVMVEAPTDDTKQAGETSEAGAAVERQTPSTQAQNSQENNPAANDIPNQNTGHAQPTALDSTAPAISDNPTDNPIALTTNTANEDTQDIPTLLPGLMDYANPNLNTDTNNTDNSIGLNLDDFTTDNLFTDAAADNALNPDASAPGGVDSIDDLFGEPTLGGGGDDAFGSGNLGGGADGDGTGAIDFDTTFNIDDLLAGDPGTGDGSGSATFDPNYFDDAFFNLGGDGA